MNRTALQYSYSSYRRWYGQFFVVSFILSVNGNDNSNIHCSISSSSRGTLIIIFPVFRNPSSMAAKHCITLDISIRGILQFLTP